MKEADIVLVEWELENKFEGLGQYCIQGNVLKTGYFTQNEALTSERLDLYKIAKKCIIEICKA